MRSPATAVLAFLVLAGACLFTPSADASGQIFGNITGALTGDPGYEGLYRYDVNLVWNLDPPAMDRADVFVQLQALDNICNCVVVKFAQPAGSSDGVDCEDGTCTVDYRGKFFCTGDVTSPFPNHGAAARFKAIEASCGDPSGSSADLDPDACSPTDNIFFLKSQSLIKCTMNNQATGHFFFYSDQPPSLPSLHANAVSLSHGDRVEFGNLFGAFPGGGSGGTSAPAPVVINEFLVKPPAGQTEFIEVFNTTGAPIDISKWRLIVTNGTYESDYEFPEGTSLPGGGFDVDSTATTTCDACLLEVQPGIDVQSRVARPKTQASARTKPQAGVRPQLVGEDFLFDQGGVIQLEDSTGAEIDRVGYGNLGGAPVSCPLILPPGVPPPPGFPGGSARTMAPQDATPETLAVSTNRAPDGTDTGIDQNDFNVGTPTAGSSNTVAQPDLGGSIRISKAYLYPRNDDADPTNESVAFFNPTTDIVNLQNLSLSDGTSIQPMIVTDHEVPLEPGEELTFYDGLNATIGFEFGPDDRMDLYISTPNGLVRVDQLGWSQIPSFFPDSCLVRVPEGTGPAGGWDWVTSGGDVNLFYQQCTLEAVQTAVTQEPRTQVYLSAVAPNPARADVSFDIVIGGTATKPVPARVAIFDVAGKLVRTVGTGLYPPGRYKATWDGRDQGGASTSPGVYFARVLVGNRPAGQSRAIVRIRG